MSCLHRNDGAIPDWFLTAISDYGEERSVMVAGAEVSYRAWGAKDAPVMVLIHGGAAHSGWWDHIAPLLAKTNRVLAVDLTGHGSSAPRSHYDFEIWAEEAFEVARNEGSNHPLIVGHSMGAVAALTASYRYAEELRGAIVIDLPDWVVTGRIPPNLDQLPPRRYYASEALAKARFRAKPEDKSRLSYIVDHVASRSIRKTPEGWTWKFDHAVTTHESFPDHYFGQPHSPLKVILAERSLLTREQFLTLESRLNDIDTVTIEDSGHHIMLDKPIALVETIVEMQNQLSRMPANSQELTR